MTKGMFWGIDFILHIVKVDDLLVVLRCECELFYYLIQYITTQISIDNQ